MLFLSLAIVIAGIVSPISAQQAEKHDHYIISTRQGNSVTIYGIENVDSLGDYYRLIERLKKYQGYQVNRMPGEAPGSYRSIYTNPPIQKAR